MAGETQKSTALTNRNLGIKRNNKLVAGTVKQGTDTHQFAAATELEAADNLILDIPLPSSCIVQSIAIYNDDLDTHACAPTLVLDFGLAAREDHTSTTSSTDTQHDEDDIIDADLLVDGDTTGRAATTNWTVLTPDATTNGPEDSQKELWELLGYDKDPKTTYNLSVQSQAASATLGAAGDLSVRVTYIVD
jgi:hypothetical protein